MVCVFLDYIFVYLASIHHGANYVNNILLFSVYSGALADPEVDCASQA